MSSAFFLKPSRIGENWLLQSLDYTACINSVSLHRHTLSLMFTSQEARGIVQPYLYLQLSLTLISDVNK